MNIEEFVALTAPDRYDFSNDGANEGYNKLDSFKDTYEKFFVYMYEEALSIKNYEEGHAGVMKYGDEFWQECESKFEGIKDPDSESDLFQQIYKKLWYDETSLGYCKEGNIIEGETMNSVNTTLDKLYKYKIETPEQKKERNSIKHIKCKNQDVSIAYIISRYAEKKTEQEERYDKIEGLRFFLSVYHTLGNFIPVPTGCNGPRGTHKTKDYWDLALKVIYDYYVKGEDHINDVVGEPKSALYKQWLDSFQDDNSNQRSWKCFVEKNYLQDFVNYNKADGSYGEPKELWKGHFSGGILPIDIEQIEQFFVNASCWITSRSVRMLLRLRKVLAEDRNAIRY